MGFAYRSLGLVPLFVVAGIASGCGDDPAPAAGGASPAPAAREDVAFVNGGSSTDSSPTGNPSLSSPTAQGCKASLRGKSAAATWCERGDYFTWDSTTTSGAKLNLFWGCAGDATKPAILMVHGWPTSSFDYAAMADDLASSYRVCWLDTPGYGFSDKPATYTYSLFEDAAIVDYFARNVARLGSFALMTHDKGDSVGLELLREYQANLAAGGSPYTITHHFLFNGNIYLPLANLSNLQLSLLDPETGSAYAESLTGTQLALSLGLATFSPPLTPSGVSDLASIFDYQDGTAVMDSTVQYLNERSQYEVTWLETLSASGVPLTMVWGEKDTIAPPDVADYVWDEYVGPRVAPARYYRHPCANHYVITDHAADDATIVRAALGGTTATFPAGDCSPYMKATH